MVLTQKTVKKEKNNIKREKNSNERLENYGFRHSSKPWYQS
ncbi:MAG: hypothetical protein OXC61_05230 [Flavobacteriaceae bacterium]|nr:hypothetical protein [Flavobacteriaceae bacterium]